MTSTALLDTLRHTVGAAQPFTHRPALNLKSFGYESMHYLLEHEVVALEVRSRWQQACDKALSLIAPSADGLSAAGHFCLRTERNSASSPSRELANTTTGRSGHWRLAITPAGTE